MPRLLVFVAMLGLAAASCGGSPPPAASAPSASSLTVKSCTVDGQAARCGTLIVPEDRLTGQGRTIPVRFVVFPAAGPDRVPDPLVFFAGGPGDSAITDSSTWLPILQNLNLGRDLVFIEQRGTGQSNPLKCPAFPSTLTDKAALRASVQSCLARLHGDLRFYTTAMFTDDVSQILTALHYATANLIGGSYGPTAEQVFLLRHPGQVRTMTLLNGIPARPSRCSSGSPGTPSWPWIMSSPCARASPPATRPSRTWRADWAALWASLGRSSWVLPAAQSPTGKTERLDQDALAWPVPGAAYQRNRPDPGRHPHPRDGREQARRMALGVQSRPGRWPDRDQRRCYPDDAVRDHVRRALGGQPARGAVRSAGQLRLPCRSGDRAVVPGTLCSLIPKSASAVGSQQLTASHVPVLAFSGAADPNDQPRNMAGAERFSPDSRDIVPPGQGHYFSSANGWDCESALIQAFIRQASAAHLDRLRLPGRCSRPGLPPDSARPGEWREVGHQASGRRSLARASYKQSAAKTWILRISSYGQLRRLEAASWRSPRRPASPGRRPGCTWRSRG